MSRGHGAIQRAILKSLEPSTIDEFPKPIALLDIVRSYVGHNDVTKSNVESFRRAAKKLEHEGLCETKVLDYDDKTRKRTFTYKGQKYEYPDHYRYFWSLHLRRPLTDEQRELEELKQQEFEQSLAHSREVLNG